MDLRPFSCFSGDRSLGSDAKRTHRIPNQVPFSLRNDEADILVLSDDSMANDMLVDKINDIHRANKVQTRLVQDDIPQKLAARLSDTDTRSLFSSRSSDFKN